jgi:uncharacterized protein
MIRIENLKVPLAMESGDLCAIAASALGIPSFAVNKVKIVRKSLDARRKSNIHFLYTLDVVVDASFDSVCNRGVRQRILTDTPETKVQSGSEELCHRPVVVGAGPAGLFAALVLAEHGYPPLIIDRGKQVEQRIVDVGSFWKNASLNLDSNVAFGEGGAGTFSDGKLMTRIKNHRIGNVLESLLQAGAPEEIMYHYRPHIGTDRLQQVLIHLRERLIGIGCEFRFNTKLTGLRTQGERLQALVVNEMNEIPCSVVLLCIGHSARDTYRMLFDAGIAMENKPFAVGFRIEHPQDTIDRIQYGKMAGHPKLPPAEYQLTAKSSDGRGVYSFCMCPGGAVIGAATDQAEVVVNGMSGSKRSGANANAALVCVVDQRDMDSSNPLTGMRLQKLWEEKAFREGGGNYQAPVQNVGDFLSGTRERKISTTSVRPTYRPGTIPGLLEECLPKPIIQGLREGIVAMGKKMPGFNDCNAILTGVETRTSAPLRIMRDMDRTSLRLKGVYPAGEGAGYAGGIISAAVDGIESAEAVIRRYKKPGTFQE